MNYFEFGPVIQEQMSFHYVSNFSSDGHSVHLRIFFYFKRWHCEELFCGILFQFGPEVQELFEYFSILSAGGQFVQWSKTICAMVVMGNILVKLCFF